MKKYTVIYELAVTLAPALFRKMTDLMTDEEIKRLSHRDDVKNIIVNITDTGSVRMKGSD